MAKTPNRTPSTGTAVNNRYPRIKPRWDADLRELWVGSILVKAYTGPAKNAELILTAFQENKWRPLLFDPLPRDHVDPRDRASDSASRVRPSSGNGTSRPRSYNNCFRRLPHSSGA